MTNCGWCGEPFEYKDLGRPRVFCTNACRTAAYRARKSEGHWPDHWQTHEETAMDMQQQEVAELIASARRDFPGGSYPSGGDDDSREAAELDRLIGEVSAGAAGSGPFRGGPNSKALQHFLQTGSPAAFGQKAAIVADAVGSIFLPLDIQADIATVARQLGMIRGLASVRPTSNIKQRAGLLSAATVGWGRLETGTAPTDAAISVSSPALDIDVHDVLALAQIGRDELDDSPEAVRAAVTEAIGIAIAEAEDAAFAAGTGSGQPKGLALAANVSRIPAGQKLAAAATATPTAADLASIPPKLPAKYRQGAVWLASTDMYAKILALLFPAAALANSAGPVIGPCNYPLYEVPGLPSAATAGVTDPSVWFVNLRYAYRVVDRGPITLQRLTQRYAELGLVGMLVKRRVGGDLVRPDAACIYLL